MTMTQNIPVNSPRTSLFSEYSDLYSKLTTGLASRETNTYNRLTLM